jgi:hypothetical protein
MTTFRLFDVVISDPKKTNGTPIRLVVPRTEIEIAKLEARYERVEKTPHVEAPPPEVSFGDAIRCLVSLYRRCERDNVPELAWRAQRALVILLGPTRRVDDEDTGGRVVQVAEHTLRGMGGS